MKKYFLLLLLTSFLQSKAADTTFFKANNPLIQYTGRIDMADASAPKFWQPGVYIRAKFKGSYCNVVINDEILYGTSHNYIAIQVDSLPVQRLQTTGKHNVITAATGLSDEEHTITICKNTEAGIGYLQFLGLQCKALLPLPAPPSRKIELIGNSITCGMGSDLSVVPCGKGQWYDQNNAYMAYGPLTARRLDAQWQLSSVSGIGLIHSCCDMKITMPRVFDKVNMREDSIKWDFSRYQPDVVTVCLGQNDGKQDSVAFCGAYVQFIDTLRKHYPSATIICLTSPMADAELTKVLQRYLMGVVNAVNSKGDRNVYRYFFSKRYHNGCGDHPDLAEHQQIADELTACIKRIKKW
ncbi:SGNH/GDSL hydrolase family protein [Chitinophaga tropicalis]|uniref:Acetyl xylan esterase n=1 Tax=Chitinophaga tropicalis TaxID=2683588 RepID=A0A7K1UAR6_9BACT|nr:SGNH/GDSL hydrolase family protein [Chitinophaga tropicalis]MVT11467.1 acetyl xylan esterase [Chitinophaga tropicalis]